MDPIPIQTGSRKISFLSRLILILFGIFFLSLIFAISIKIFQEIGIWIGLIVCSAVIFCGFYYTMPFTRLRIITWSMLITLILGIILYFTGLTYLKNTLEGF